MTQLALDQFAERLIAASLLTRADIEQARREAQDPARTFGGPIGVFAWGRKAIS